MNPTGLSPHDLNLLQAMMLSAGSLSQVMQTPFGAGQYRAMTVPQRLEMLQHGGLSNLTPSDAGLLQLLRSRREREAGFAAPQPSQLLGPARKHTVSNSAGLSQNMANTFQQAANSLR